MKQPNDLMQPRYKVIADYPGSKFKVGDVLYYDEYFGVVGYTPNPIEFAYAIRADKYPSIFQPLKWWEERTAEEMPEYVKDYKIGRVVVKIAEWANDGSYFITEANVSSGYRSHTPYYVPATEQEYQTYKASQ